MLVALLALGAAPAGAAPAGPAPITPVPYGTDAVEYGTAYPAPVAGEPTVLFVHGGWWEEQQPGVQIDWRVMLQAQREGGAFVFAIDYPQLCGSAKIAHCGLLETEAVERAFRWVRLHAGEYGGDPGNVELLGASAGGQLAERAANEIMASEPGALASVAELSAPGLNFQTFVRELIDGESNESGGIPTAHYLGCHIAISTREDTCSEEAEIAESPIDDLPAPQACVPQLVAWGEANDLVDKAQSIEYANALQANGCEVERAPQRGGHAIDYWTALKPTLFAFWAAH
jgi:acetyl esterase/lipase